MVATTHLSSRSTAAQAGYSDVAQSSDGQRVPNAKVWSTTLAHTIDRSLCNYLVVAHRGSCYWHGRLGCGTHRRHHGAASNCSDSIARPRDLGTNLIAAEVESGGWQLLRAAPISPLRIVVGKLMSTIWTLLLLLLATLPGYLVMSYIQPAIGGQVGNVVVSLVIAIVMVATISACVSAFSRTTAVATATSYGLLLALFAGSLLIWLSRGKPFGTSIRRTSTSLLNPTAMAPRKK